MIDVRNLSGVDMSAVANYYNAKYPQLTGSLVFTDSGSVWDCCVYGAGADGLKRELGIVKHSEPKSEPKPEGPLERVISKLLTRAFTIFMIGGLLYAAIMQIIK